MVCRCSKNNNSILLITKNAQTALWPEIAPTHRDQNLTIPHRDASRVGSWGLVQVVFGISWFYALCASWPVERLPNALLMAPFFFKTAFAIWQLCFAPPFWAMLWASILAILGLNLGKALGLYFDHFGAEYGQGSGHLFCRFWGWKWGMLWASILAILGLNLGRAWTTVPHISSA